MAIGWPDVVHVLMISYGVPFEVIASFLAKFCSVITPCHSTAAIMFKKYSSDFVQLGSRFSTLCSGSLRGFLLHRDGFSYILLQLYVVTHNDTP